MSDFNIEFEENDQQIKLEFEQAGGGAVKSVNGKTGVVVLDADDVGAYTKPSGGIPKTDLASAVQTSLGKADSAYQKPSGGIPANDIASGVVPAVDNTLTVSGAAADAKKVGDEISTVKDGFHNNELNVADAIGFQNEAINLSWEIGSRNGTTPVASNARIRAKDFFPVKLYKEISVTVASGYKFELDYYGKDGSYINRYGSGWTTTNIVLDLTTSTFTNVYRMSILLARTDSANMSTSESVNVTITGKTALKDSFESADLLGSATPYNLGAGTSGYVNKNNGTIGSVAGAYHSGKIAVGNASKLAVKNTFRYDADGIAIYDKSENFICGYGRSSFSGSYLDISLPVNAYYFDITWYTGLDAVVASYFKNENNIIGTSDVMNEFTEYSNNVFNNWNSQTILVRNSNGTATYTTPTSGNTGFYGFPSLHPSSNLLHVYLDFTATDNTKLKLYAIGTSKSGTANSIYNLSKSFSAGANHYELDVNWLEVYSTIDTSKPFSILVANDTRTGGVCTITKFLIGTYEKDLDGYYGANLSETLANIKTAIGNAPSMLDGYQFLVTPNGVKYIRQIKNDLTEVLIPVIPNKAMFFGNSLILGFNENYGIETDPYGMAASDKDHDYYALFNGYVTALNANYTPNRFRTSWEGATTASEYRSFTDEMLAYVDDTTQLIIVQLGDNINSDAKKAVFPDNAKNLLMELRTKAPNARVAWVGSWFNSALIEQVMTNICADTGCTFVSISDLNTVENQNVVGGKYYDSNGGEHTIESSGVASHPSNLGFKAIANRMLYRLNLAPTENAIT